MRSALVLTEDEKKNESFTSSLVTKVVDNLQITVRNIHIRYEDALSNPEVSMRGHIDWQV